MEIELWFIGKTTEDYIQKGLNTYLAKLAHYTKIEIKLFKESKGLKEIHAIRKSEEMAINKALLGPGLFVILLDERGKSFSSIKLAHWLEHDVIPMHRKICFLIGGAYGFSDEVKEKAHALISLSNLTFTHQMSRLILAEQLFRAFTIIHKIPYHNE